MSKKRYAFFFLFLLLVSAPGFSQTTRLLKSAEGNLNTSDYYYALQNYLKVYELKPNDQAVIEKILMCNEYLRNYSDVLTWSELLVSLNGKNPVYRLRNARALHNLGKYKEAKTAYREYLKIVPQDKTKIDFLIRSCDSALNWQHMPVVFKVLNMASINTRNSDWGLARYKNGYMFSSDRLNENAELIHSMAKENVQEICGRTGRPYLKLYTVNENSDLSFGKPAFYAGLSLERYHTSSSSFDSKNDILYFARTRRIDLSNSFNKSVFKVELVYSQASKAVKSFAFNSILDYSVGDPSISANGKRLYFASNMPGGYGGSDLYYSDLNSDGSWTKPTNLGPHINTAGQERYPSLAGDSVLYFSSDGYIGMGGLDIYSAHRTKSGWADTKNMGPPVNSAEDDFALIITRSEQDLTGPPRIQGYFSSDRPGGKGSDDIYAFKTIAPVSSQPVSARTDVIIQGKIVDVETEKGIPEVKMAVHEADSPGPVKTIRTDSAGVFKFAARQHKKYALAVKLPHYFAKKDTLSSDMRTTAARTSFLKVEPMVLNKAIRLDNIYYKFNEWGITTQAATVLEGVATIMKDNPEIDVELASYTDTRGDQAINLYISQMRAQSAVDYLISIGVGAKRIYAKGYGKSTPLVHCGKGCTLDDHAKNRRTEFKIVRIHGS